MKAYYRNALKTAALSATNMDPGESAADLAQQDLERTVSFSGASSVITASWAPQAALAADALFISNTSAFQGSLRLYDQNQAPRQSIGLQLGKRNNKIEFPALAVGRMELSLQAPAGAKLYAGLLFLALGAALPRFAPGADMSDELRGAGGRSYGGQAHGMAGVTLGTLSLSWKRVAAGEREEMRRYADAVQFDAAHYISPWDGEDLYVTIAEAGSWPRHAGPGFYWDTSIKYLEAR
jgi:hypothetical protein